MTFKFGWLDYSKEDSALIDSALRELEKKTIEQLGFSSVRNNFRALLFPGAANPMTRLRYNYFTAYIASNLEYLAKHFNNKSSQSVQTQAEKKIRNILIKNRNEYGIFGLLNENRVPHQTYWGNLYIYGLVDRSEFPYSWTYFKEVDQKWKRSVYTHKDEGEHITESSFRFTLEKLSESMTSVIDRLTRGVKSSENEDIINFKLTSEETKHFEETIRKNFPDSLLHILIRDRKSLLSGKNPVMLEDYSGLMWHGVEERYMLGKDSNSLTDDLKRNLCYTFIFQRLMGVAYSYYNAMLFEQSEDDDVLSDIDSLRSETLEALNKYPYKPEELFTFMVIHKWGSKQGELFLNDIYEGLKKGKDPGYFKKIVIEREMKAKTPALAKLHLNKYESGEYIKVSFGYDLNIRMVRRYLLDMGV